MNKWCMYDEFITLLFYDDRTPQAVWKDGRLRLAIKAGVVEQRVSVVVVDRHHAYLDRYEYRIADGHTVESVNVAIELASDESPVFVVTPNSVKQL